MSNKRTILITGATGNLGAKLTGHLEGRYELRRLDIDPRGDTRVVRADLRQWNRSWVEHFKGADAVVHLAADPRAHVPWPDLIGPNVDGLINTFLACKEGGVRRLIFASSNHVMGGYQHEAEPAKLSPDTPPRPGTKYVVEGQMRDSTPYGSAKLFGERLGKCFAEAHGLSVIAVRIGWVRPGANLAAEIPPERGPWFRLMWLSNRDFCQVMEKCILADASIRFAVVNAMSDNAGMRWDLDPTRRLIGYESQDGLA